MALGAWQMWLFPTMKRIPRTSVTLVAGLFGMVMTLVQWLGVTVLRPLSLLSSPVVPIAVEMTAVTGGTLVLITSMNLCVPRLRGNMLVLALKVTGMLVPKVCLKAPRTTGLIVSVPGCMTLGQQLGWCVNLLMKMLVETAGMH